MTLPLVTTHIKARKVSNHQESPLDDPRNGFDDDDLSNVHPRFRAGVEVYRSDVRVYRKFQDSVQRKGGGKRSDIQQLTKTSRNRMVFAARNTEPMQWFVTLTYANVETDGQMVKHHLRLIRKVLTRRGIRGFWWLEFQRRGAPHFHMVIDRYISPDELTAHWLRIIGVTPCEHCRIETRKRQRKGGCTQFVLCPNRCQYSRSYNAGVSVEWFVHQHAFAAYVAKEGAKMQQKTVPETYNNVGRFWGYWGYRIKSSITLYGHLTQIAPLIRIIRKLNNVRRKRDNGRYGFIGWGVGCILHDYGDRIFVNGQTLRSYQH